MSEECNKCKIAGFPGQMLNFKVDPNRAPAAGRKHFWILLNPDGTAHEHKTKATEQTTLEQTTEQAKSVDTNGDTAKYPHHEILASLGRIEKQNNIIIDWISEQAGD